MQCDMVVAVGSATVDGRALFGHNFACPAQANGRLVRQPARKCALGESLVFPGIEIAQARQTFDILGTRPEKCWGYVHGVNEHHVAIGCVPLLPTATGSGPSLAGTDLVRLGLERCHSACQALDLLTHLLQRHGRAAGGDDSAYDPAFVIADPVEAFVVESAGGYWAAQETGAARAVSSARVIRQDWDRIAPGFSESAINQGCWPRDGTKVDFAGSVREPNPDTESAWRRWGHATLFLERRNGRLSPRSLRELLSDHAEVGAEKISARHPATPASLCLHDSAPENDETAASFIASLHALPDRLPYVWYAFGPPCWSVYLPLFLHGELPEALTAADAVNIQRRLRRLRDHVRDNPHERRRVREELTRLQARFDQEAEEFAAEGAHLKAQGSGADVPRLAGAFMQHIVELLEVGLLYLLRERASAAVAEW